ncbi:MAG: chemotaxis protein CheX [Armatimonadetes bacterium]|nr:chemotaxis protein CheX [Armatimonadota bacterium]
MEIKLYDDFVSVANEVLKKEVKAEAKKGRVSICRTPFAGNDINVLVGVTGNIEGVVIYGMSNQTALAMASIMMEEEFHKVDEMVLSGIAELGNVITGLVSKEIEQKGYTIDLSPPTLIVGKGTSISSPNIQRIVVPLTTEHGALEVNISLRERQSKGGR